MFARGRRVTRARARMAVTRTRTRTCRRCWRVWDSRRLVSARLELLELLSLASHVVLQGLHLRVRHLQLRIEVLEGVRCLVRISVCCVKLRIEILDSIRCISARLLCCRLLLVELLLPLSRQEMHECVREPSKVSSEFKLFVLLKMIELRRRLRNQYSRKEDVHF